MTIMYYLSLPARAGQKLRVRGQRNFPFFLKYFVYNADIYSIMSDMRKQALAWWRGLTWPEKCAIIQEHVSGDSVEMRTSVIDKSSIQIERVFRETQK